MSICTDFIEMWKKTDEYFIAWQSLLGECIFSEPESESGSLALGPNEMARLGIIRREHRQIFVCFHRAVGARYLSFRSCPLLRGTKFEGSHQITGFSCDSNIARTKCLLVDLLRRQQLELRGARAMDSIKREDAAGSRNGSFQLHFGYPEMFVRAEEFQKRVNLCLVDLLH